ncbi:MAG: dihydrolipoyl dehydrogenase family protein, partial [Myxococcota bacterium]
DSTDMLSLTSLPESLLIVGGGVIGVEFAMIMATFGVKVYLSEILKRIIATEDVMVSRVIQNRLKSLGVDVNTDVKIDEFKISNESVQVKLSNGKSLSVEKVLVAAGRRPVINISDDLKRQLINERGFVMVDESLRTRISNIYAAGDVIGGIMLAHKAHYDGEVAVDNILGRSRKADYSAVPAVIYTQPEVASVGMSEERAKEKGIEIKTGRFFVASNGMAMAKNATEGFVKIIAEKESGRIVGGTILCESASEMVTALTMAIKEGMTYKNIHDLIWPHPTISESVGEAMRDIEQMAIHKVSI